MASIIGHTIAGIAFANSYLPNKANLKLYLLAVICSFLPDFDAISFRLGIPYDHVLGHRGISHSILFAFFIGALVVGLFYRSSLKSWSGLGYFMFFSLCVLTHDIFDAMSNGGLGVAFFAPFNEKRYFFPWRPIEVSPLSVKAFLSERGWRVIKSELLWIGIPSVVYSLIVVGINRYKKR